jgi:hypothetical protein
LSSHAHYQGIETYPHYSRNYRRNHVPLGGYGNINIKMVILILILILQPKILILEAGNMDLYGINNSE